MSWFKHPSIHPTIHPSIYLFFLSFPCPSLTLFFLLPLSSKISKACIGRLVHDCVCVSVCMRGRKKRKNCSPGWMGWKGRSSTIAHQICGPSNALLLLRMCFFLFFSISTMEKEGKRKAKKKEGFGLRLCLLLCHCLLDTLPLEFTLVSQ